MVYRNVDTIKSSRRKINCVYPFTALQIFLVLLGRTAGKVTFKNKSLVSSMATLKAFTVVLNLPKVIKTRQFRCIERSFFLVESRLSLTLKQWDERLKTKFMHEIKMLSRKCILCPNKLQLVSTERFEKTNRYRKRK